MTSQSPRVSSLYDLLQVRMGVEVSETINPLTSTLGTTAQLIAANNPRRLALLVVNLSGVAVYIRPLAPASSTNGIRLGPSGGAVSMAWDADFGVVGKEWYGVAEGVGSSIFVLEVIIR